MLLTYLSIIGMAALPVVELKGAIPYGVAMGVDPWLCFFLALFGSCLPAPLIMRLFHPVAEYAHRKDIRILNAIMDFARNRAEKKKGKVTRYQNFQLLGLFVFVAIPLPTTGVWTGAIIATLLMLPMRKAVPTIWTGNVVAGLIVFLLTGRFL